MPEGHLRTIMGAVVAGLLLLLPACGDQSAPIEGTMGAAAEPEEASGNPMAGAPAVGTCYKLGYPQTSASTNNSASVSCYDNHTAITYHVGLFPEGATFADEARAEKVCAQKLPQAVGIGKKKLLGTYFDHVWFEPSATQWEAGGRWFRCDAVAPVDSKLKRLPNSQAPFFYDGKVEDSWARCLQSKGAEKDGNFVSCDKKHDYRWAGAFSRPGVEKYPTEDQALAWGKKECADRVSTQNWWITWPSSSRWSDGERWLSCYENTSS